MGCSNDNYWKLDKWDKIGIASLILFFTLFVVLNTFCFASESSVVNGTLIEGLYFNPTDTPSVINRGGALLIYYELIPGHNYTLINDSGRVVAVGFFNSIPDVGSLPSSPSYVYDNYSFSLNNTTYFVFSVTSSSSLDDVVLYDNTPGFSGVIGNLSLSVGFNYFWLVFINSIPFVLVVVLVVFGIYLISHAIREISKGRDI